MLPSEEEKQRIVDIVKYYIEPLYDQVNGLKEELKLVHQALGGRINELHQEIRILHRELGREMNDNRRQSQYSSEELMGLERFRQSLIENSESDLGKFKMRMLDNEELKVIEHALNSNFSDTPTSLDESTANEEQPHN